MAIYDYSILIPYLHKLELMIWDCDATLVDNETTALDQIREEINRFWVSYAKNSGYNVSPSTCDISCARPLAGRPLPDIRKHYAKYTGIDFPPSIDEEIKKRRENSPESGERVMPIEPFVQLVSFLSDHGKPQRVATGSEADRAIRYLKASGIHGTLKASARQYLFAGHKPNPTAHRRARMSLLQTELGRPAHFYNTIAIEDSLSGIKGGVNAGVVPVGHTLASHIAEKAKRKHAHALRQAGAVAVIERAGDAPAILLEVIKSLPEPSRKTSPTRRKQLEHVLL